MRKLKFSMKTLSLKVFSLSHFISYNVWMSEYHVEINRHYRHLDLFCKIKRKDLR